MRLTYQSSARGFRRHLDDSRTRKPCVPADLNRLQAACNSQNRTNEKRGAIRISGAICLLFVIRIVI